MAYSKAILMRELKGNGFTFNLENISNDEKNIGCMGTITNPKNGVMVSVNTVKLPLVENKMLFRFVGKDGYYKGENNHFASRKDFAKEIIDALNHPERAKEEVKIFYE